MQSFLRQLCSAPSAHAAAGAASPAASPRDAPAASAAVAAEWRPLVLLAQLLCVFLAFFVSQSRLVDNRHRAWDVVAGTLLGVLGGHVGGAAHARELQRRGGAAEERRSDREDRAADHEAQRV